MSEHEPINHEQQSHTPETAVEQVDNHPEKAVERSPKHEKSIAEIQHSIEQHATPAKELHVDATETQSQPTMIDRAMKSQTYRLTLGKIRTRLSTPQRALSKVVHQPMIEAASEVGSKTVARPSGILGGGIVALLGSGIIVFLSRKYGFSYNFFVFILLYVAGFIAGMVIELGYYALRRARRGR